MKVLNTVICVMAVTGFVACSKKGGGSGNPQNPTYYQQYGNQVPHNNDLYPQTQIPNGPSVPQIPGCSVPPMLNGDLYHDCNVLATLTDCDSNAVDQIFIRNCYGMPMQRPGCVPVVPVVVAATCGSTCVDDDYVSTRRSRSYEREERRERTSSRSTRTVVRDVRDVNDKVSTVREPVRSSENVRVVERHSTPSRSRIVVEDNSTPRNNAKNAPKECVAKAWEDCTYKRSVGRRGVHANKVTWADVDSRDRNNKSFFDRQIEAGNIRCEKNGLKNLVYFDYLKEVEKNCFGSSEPVVETRREEVQEVAVAQPVQESAPAKQEALEPQFDSSKCQWIVDIHNMLNNAQQGLSSFSRQYTVKPVSTDKSLTEADLKEILTYANHGANITVLPGKTIGSAIGSSVAIENDLLIVGQSAEIIKACEAKRIVTQAQKGNHFVTTTYMWDGSKGEDGEIDVQSAIAFNAYNKSAKQVDITTSRLIIWKKGVTESTVRAKFERDSRLTSRTKARNNSLDLTCRVDGGCSSK